MKQRANAVGGDQENGVHNFGGGVMVAKKISSSDCVSVSVRTISTPCCASNCSTVCRSASSGQLIVASPFTKVTSTAVVASASMKGADSPFTTSFVLLFADNS